MHMLTAKFALFISIPCLSSPTPSPFLSRCLLALLLKNVSTRPFFTDWLRVKVLGFKLVLFVAILHIGYSLLWIFSIFVCPLQYRKGQIGPSASHLQMLTVGVCSLLFALSVSHAIFLLYTWEVSLGWVGRVSWGWSNYETMSGGEVSSVQVFHILLVRLWYVQNLKFRYANPLCPCIQSSIWKCLL